MVGNQANQIDDLQDSNEKLEKEACKYREKYNDEIIGVENEMETLKLSLVQEKAKQKKGHS